MVLLGVALPGAAQSTFYFPRVLATADTATGIALSNPTQDTASITMTYFSDTGTVIGSPAIVSIGSAGQIAKLSTEFFTGAANKRGWVKL